MSSESSSEILSVLSIKLLSPKSKVQGNRDWLNPLSKIENSKMEFRFEVLRREKLNIASGTKMIS